MNLATVITNLLSAIPWVGQDIVESIKYNNTEYLALSLITFTNTDLPKIGEISKRSNINIKKILTKQEYMGIPDKFLSFLVGFIDGDGYIQIGKSARGYVNIKLTISIHLNDISILKYIVSVLKIGKIYENTDRKTPMCRLVFNRSELQLVLFPLLKYHNIFFLTENRRYQYNTAMDILTKNILFYDDLPKLPTVYYKSPKYAKDYLDLKFFNDWIVGFVEADGSFLMKASKDGCFQVKQKLHHTLFEAFCLVFETDRKITIDKGLYLQLSVSSKKDIQKVINFFSFSGLHSLTGLKYISYMKWLNDLKNSVRYKNLIYPS